MKKAKLLISFILVGLGLFILPSFAAELNSGNIAGEPFNCSTGATSCDLSSKGITAIASGTFINHISLQELDLGKNIISSVESGDFAGLGNLRYLYLSENSISSIESGDFNGLGSLSYLYLNENEISSIESGNFNGLGSLIKLNFYDNEISSIESGDFNGLGSLSYLYLNENEISSIESGSFTSVSGVTTFDINYNELCIGSLAQSILDFIDEKTALNSRTADWQATQDTTNCPILGMGCTDPDANNYDTGATTNDNSCTYDATVLHSGNITQSPYLCPISATTCDLSSKGITAIASGTFVNHINLEILYLDNNSISSLENGDFSGLENLKELRLGGNSISSIESGDFSGLGNLEQLRLGDNSISSIESGDFSGLSNIQSLYLQDNGINSIESSAFSELTLLTNLRLNGNSISSIESGCFSGLENLESLYLYSNNISKIESGNFSRLGNLTYLSLLSNEISSIKSGAFNGLENLEALYLQNNKINSIESGSFADLAIVYFFNIDNNELCTGSLADSILDFINTKTGGTEWQATQDTTNCPVLGMGCTDPDANNYDTGATTDDNSCTYDVIVLHSGNIVSTYFCPISATTCDLSNKGITAIASGTFVNHISLEYLYLNDNGISSIESGDFNGLGNLEELYLSNNNISSIESGDFNGLASLYQLRLQNNQISSIESGDFNGLGSLRWLYLKNNGLSSIESGDFDGLGNLEYLELTYNSISSIESGDFNGLGSLIYLYLNENEISSIESGDFNGLGSLRWLILDHNSISSIESGSFSGLGSLETLRLSENSISSIESGDFNGLGSLQTLNLSENSISSIESGDFNGLGSLQLLRLNNNSLSSIESGSFTSVLGVTTFDINSNELCTGTLAQSILDFINEKTALNSRSADWQSIQDTTNCPVLDTVSPTGAIIYSTTGATNEDVIATISLSETGTVTNNSNLLTYTFTENGIFIFEFEDIAGNTGEKIAEVDWIDKSKPTAEITYSPNSATNGEVIATISLSETGTVTNNSNLLTYIFTGNGSFKFEFEDLAGNTGEKTADVNWIDKIKPTANIIYIPGSGAITSGDVLAILTGMSKTGFISNNDGNTGYIFTGNGTYTFRFVDLVGNTGEAVANVDWIDKEAPVVVGITNGTTYTTSVTLIGVTDNIGVESVVLDGTGITQWTGYVINVIGTHSIVVRDLLGNNRTVSFEVKKKSSSGGGGGGGYYITPTDLVEETVDEIVDTPEENIDSPADETDGGGGSEYEEELEDAYEFAKENNITTTDDLAEFDADGVLLRKHLAKMISEFAINIMNRVPESIEGCEEFEDMAGETEEMQKYATIACNLGLMGWESNQLDTQSVFGANLVVDRAQFGTILSRLLRGDTYATDDAERFYKNHLEALKERGIMTMISDPFMNELRGWVIMMMYRVQEYEKANS